MITDVAHVCRTQQRIADGVNQHIGIAMPQQTFLMLKPDASQPQFAPFDQPMDIESKPTRIFISLLIIY